MLAYYSSLVNNMAINITVDVLEILIDVYLYLPIKKPYSLKYE